MAAYALGMLTVVFLQTKRPIPHVLMDAAMGVTTAAEAFRWDDAARAADGLMFTFEEPTKRQRQRCLFDRLIITCV